MVRETTNRPNHKLYSKIRKIKKIINLIERIFLCYKEYPSVM